VGVPGEIRGGCDGFDERDEMGRDDEESQCCAMRLAGFIKHLRRVVRSTVSRHAACRCLGLLRRLCEAFGFGLGLSYS
jgi:hypothetical protein